MPNSFSPGSPTPGELIDALQPIVQRVRTDITAVRGADGRQAWTREPLTRGLLAQHVNGGPARGVCPIKAGESVTSLALLDLDSHKGEVSWERMVDVAEQISGALVMRGVVVNPWRSRGGSGMHLIALWDSPQDAYSVRREMVEALEDCGLHNGTGGVALGQVEVFPKQDSVPVDGNGNQFILPLAGASEPLIPALGWDGGGREAAVGMTWLISEPVAVRERPVREAVATTPSGDTERLRAALAAIPNDGEGLNYDTWRDIIFAIHHATDGGGLDLAHAFSQRSNKYDPAFLDERVWPYVKPGGGITEATIFKMATEAGWQATVPATADDFDVIAPEPLTDGEPAPLPVFQRDKAGRIEHTMDNVVKALERPDLCGAHLAFDQFKDCVMVGRDGMWAPLRDVDYTDMRVALERAGFKATSKESVRDGIHKVADQNRFDSAQQWADGLKWDGVERVSTFFSDHFSVPPSAYTAAVGQYLWSAMAGRALVPGVKADMVPVLISGQGTRKTSMVEALCPTEDAFVEINLEHRDDNLARSLRGKLVAELAELRGLATRDAEGIKAWISRRVEEWTPKYVEHSTRYARRFIAIGTGNNTEFLDDETGERRWLPIQVGQVDVEAIKRDRDQLWAEGVVLFKTGGVRWAGAQQLAHEVHADFKVRDPWQEHIAAWLALDGMDGAGGPARGAGEVRADDVLAGALRIDAKAVNRAMQMRVAKVLKALGYERVTAWVNGKTTKVWRKSDVAGLV